MIPETGLIVGGLLAGPILLGAAIGRTLGPRSLPAALCSGAAAATLWDATLRALAPDRVSVHELFWLLPLILWATWIAASPQPPALARRVLASALFLGATEAGSRSIGWTPREDPWPPSLAAGPSSWPFPCHPEVAARHPDDQWEARSAPWVYHLGDSMTVGPGPRSDTFVGRLDRSDPRRSHLKLALAGTGPDCALHLFRQLPNPQAVFLHLFPKNDAYDIGTPMPWCDERPLLGLEDPDLPSLCVDGPRDLPWRRRLAWDPSPYLHRWLSTRSALFHQLQEVWWSPMAFRLGPLTVIATPEVAYGRAEPVIGQLVTEAHTRGVPLFATLLPWSGVRPQDEPTRDHLRRDSEAWREILTHHQIPFLDLTDSLADRTDPPVPGVYASDTPPDPHFGPLGFQRIYELMRPWVEQQLAAMERDQDPGAAEP